MVIVFMLMMQVYNSYWESDVFYNVNDHYRFTWEFSVQATAMPELWRCTTISSQRKVLNLFFVLLYNRYFKIFSLYIYLCVLMHVFSHEICTVSISQFISQSNTIC